MAKKTKSKEPEAAIIPPDPQGPAEAQDLTANGPSEKREVQTAMSFVPGAVRKPLRKLAKAMVWIYGPPKVGKTTLASKFPGAWFIATEKGQDWVEVREPTLVSNWDEFLELMSQIAEHQPTHFGDGQPIQTLVIDVVDLLFNMCKDSVCRELGVTDPGELTHGKGWSRLSTEFQRVMMKVRHLPYGLVCISHSRDREMNIGATKRTRFEPDIGAGGMRIIGGMADLILYCRSEQYAVTDADGKLTGEIADKRLMRCHPSSAIVAGGRMADRLPAEIPMDYDELAKYFN